MEAILLNFLTFKLITIFLKLYMKIYKSYKYNKIQKISRF